MLDTTTHTETQLPASELDALLGRIAAAKDRLAEAEEGWAVARRAACDANSAESLARTLITDARQTVAAEENTLQEWVLGQVNDRRLVAEPSVTIIYEN
jgi:hypothetical protein